jgi:hypothetical protein
MSVDSTGGGTAVARFEEEPMRAHTITACVPIAAFAAIAAPQALAADVDIVREVRQVPSAGVLTTCSDGSTILFSGVSERDYTTWFRDGIRTREHRHLSFEGTLSREDLTVTYTGVWNRDQDFVTGEVRITGGQFRVASPDGSTLVGAGVRADGNEFKGTGDRFLTDLCTALGA